jgi:hypothetical protein
MATNPTQLPVYGADKGAVLLCWEAIEQTDEPDLIGKAESVLRPPALIDLTEIGRRQQRILLELAARVTGLSCVVRHAGHLQIIDVDCGYKL